MFSEVSFCEIGLDSTYANKASPPTPRLAISMIPFTWGVSSLIVVLSAAGIIGAGASAGGGSGITSVELIVVGIGSGVSGSNFDKSAVGLTDAGAS